MKSIGRDLLISISLSNLCFLKVWGRLLDPKQAYFDPGWRTHELLALLILTIGLAGILTAATQFVRRKGGPLAHSAMSWAFLMAVLVTFLYGGTAFLGKMGMIWVGVAFLTGIGAPVAYLRWRPRMRRMFITALLIMSPFAALTFVQAAYFFKKGNDTFRDSRVAEMVQTEKFSPRVVWIVFDELDEKVAFDEHPSGQSLPEFEKFRSQALTATNAHPPADGTFMSLPALLSGSSISAALPMSENKLLLRLADTGTWVSWREQPNIFRRARAMGVNSALVGWYHPYCRVIADSVNFCAWTGGPYDEMFYRAPYSELGKIAYREVLEVFGNRQWIVSHDRTQSTKQHVFLAEQSKQALGNPAYGLVFLHLSVPHPPGFYDRRTRTWSADRASYLDNLALADRTFGEIRALLERAGTWDDTAVLVTSDHWFRTWMWRGKAAWTNEDEAVFSGRESHRVPFMLKLPRENVGVRYDKPFNTVVSADIVAAILARQAADPQSVTKLIENLTARVNQTTYREDENVLPPVFHLPDLLP